MAGYIAAAAVAAVVVLVLVTSSLSLSHPTKTQTHTLAGLEEREQKERGFFSFSVFFFWGWGLFFLSNKEAKQKRCFTYKTQLARHELYVCMCMWIIIVYLVCVLWGGARALSHLYIS